MPKRACASVTNGRVIRQGWRRKLNWERDAKMSYDGFYFEGEDAGNDPDYHYEDDEYDDNNCVSSEADMPTPPMIVRQKATLRPMREDVDCDDVAQRLQRTLF